MRLLDANTLEFKEFFEGNIPPYAILSHTWEKDEVTFQSFQLYNSQVLVTPSAGYEKVRRACVEAQKHNLQYIWVDTCCIDKTNSTELAESINTMFKWYQMADLCFAYLANVHSNTFQDEPGPDLEDSRWFTRGWTLQELLAPKRVLFFASDWKKSFDLNSVVERVSKITNIAPQYLCDDQKARQSWIDQASLAEKMSWAASRDTTVTEDLAYCLLGIFGFTMPLVYGEGRQAFIRLQEQIIHRRFDPTLFAWNAESEGKPLDLHDPLQIKPAMSAALLPSEQFVDTWVKKYQSPKIHQAYFAFAMLTGLDHPWCHARSGYVSNSITGFLAESPKLFRKCSNIVPSEATVAWSLTSKGSILIQLPVSEDEYPYMVLPCGIRGNPFRLIALPLVPSRDGQYNRAKHPAKIVSHDKWYQWPMKNVDLASQAQDFTGLPGTLRKTLHIGKIPPGYKLFEVYPSEACSCTSHTVCPPYLSRIEWIEWD